MVSVDDPRHAKLEADMNEFLDAQGFMTASATYHTVMPAEVRDRLSRVNTPSALYLRTRADRVAIHRKHQVCFEYECKTRDPATIKTNLAIEAFPLAQHIYKARLGVKVLYAYRDEANGIDCGFWCDRLPPIDKIIVPHRGEAIAAYLSQAFPGIGQVRMETRGSGDPFVLIPFEVAQQLDDWRMEVIAELHPYLQKAAVTNA
jgi:hypothetical protein